MDERMQTSWSTNTLIITVLLLLTTSLSDRLFTWNNSTLIKADQIQIISMTESMSDEYDVDGFAVAVKDTYVNGRIMGTKLGIVLIIIVVSLLSWVAEKRRKKKESNLCRQ